MLDTKTNMINTIYKEIRNSKLNMEKFGTSSYRTIMIIEFCTILSCACTKCIALSRTTQ